MLLLTINGILLKLGNIILTFSDERKDKQKKIAQDAKNDTQDKQEVISYIKIIGRKKEAIFFITII